MSAPNFGNVKSDAGLQKLDDYLAINSFVTGHNPSQDDVATFAKLLGMPGVKFPHAARWARHIASFTVYERTRWPGAEAVAAKDEDEEFDLFGEETAEETSAAKTMKPAAPKAEKKKVINKSQLIIEVKPSSLDTNLDELEKLVKGIQMNGVEWSVTCKKVPIAYGLMKLQIGCNIIDDLVNTDDIIAKIECLGLDEKKAAEKISRRDAGDDDQDEEDMSQLVQSAEIVSFNKL